jgi:hypothetical protein
MIVSNRKRKEKREKKKIKGERDKEGISKDS